jgi:hypothetical protein
MRRGRAAPFSGRRAVDQPDHDRKGQNSTGHALNGAIENADSTPAASAMAARFHPQARMIERPTARNVG